MKSNKTPEVRTPAPPAEQVDGVMPLDRIRPCPFNFRKQFPADDIAALAQSIKEIGLKERLLVRPIGTRFVPEFKDGRWNGVDHFELADGERRYRALKLAGVENVPVAVRIMTDAEVRAVMIASREQSRDLLPSELAAGYAALVADGLTLDDIAEKVGQSVGHIRSVLALVKLPANVLKAVDDGKLPRRTAELVARVPGDKARAECAAWVLAGDRFYDRGQKPDRGDGEALSYRATGEFIAKNFQVELKSASFNRKALDLVGGVGSCDECPKMAGNAAKADESFKSVRADMCLDPVCFNKKTEAHNKIILKTAKETGKKILSAKESQKLFPYGDNLDYGAQYVDLGAKCYLEGGKGRTYKTLLKDVEPDQVVVALDRKGTPHELVKRDVADKFLKKAGVGGRGSRADSASDQRWKAEEKKRRKEEEARKAAAVKACDKVAEAIGIGFADKLPLENWEQYIRPLVGALIETVWEDASRLVVKRRQLGKGGLGRDHIARCAATLDVYGLLALAAELLAAKYAAHQFGAFGMDKEEKAFWAAFNIDPKVLVKQAQAEQKKPAARFKPDYEAIERDAKLGSEKKAPAKKDNRQANDNLAKSTEPAYKCEAGKKKLGGGKLGKASKNGHKPGCSMPAAIADGMVNGLPAKVPSIAKPLSEIEGFPPALATCAEEAGCGTDIALSERVNKVKGKLSHEEKIAQTLEKIRVAGGAMPGTAEKGTEAFLNYLYPGRAKKNAKPAKNGKPTPATKTVGSRSPTCPAFRPRLCPPWPRARCGRWRTWSRT